MASIEYIELLKHLGVEIEDDINEINLKELKELVLEAFDIISDKVNENYSKWLREYKINVHKTIKEDINEIHDYIKIINESSTNEEVIQNAIYQLKLIIELIERLGEYKKRRNNNIARGPRAITRKRPRGFGEVRHSEAEPNFIVLDPSVIANRKRQSIYYRGVNTPGMNNFRSFGSQTRGKRTGKLRSNIIAYTNKNRKITNAPPRKTRNASNNETKEPKSKRPTFAGLENRPSS